MTAQTQQTQLSSRRWLVLASAVVSFFAVGVTFFAVPPLVPELTTRFALSHLQIGVLMGAIAVPAIFLSMPLGAAVDRWPARAAGVASLLLMAAGGLLFAVAPSYPVLVGGRVVFGLGGLVMNLLLARLISSAFAGRELSLAMGIFMAVYPASMITMFSSHSWLLERLGWRLELLALAALALAALPVHLLAVPPTAASAVPADPVAAPRRRRVGLPLAALAAAWMLFFVAFASVLTFAPEWAGGDHSALLTVTAVMWTSLILSPVAGFLIDRSGRPEVWATAGLAVLAAVLTAMAADLLAPLHAMLFVGLAAATVPTATYSLPGRLAPAGQVGFAFGLITAFSNLGTLAGPAASGVLRDAGGGWAQPWLVVAGAAFVGACCYPLTRSDPNVVKGGNPRERGRRT